MILNFMIYKYGLNIPFSHWIDMKIKGGNNCNNCNNYYKENYVNYEFYTNVNLCILSFVQ